MLSKTELCKQQQAIADMSLSEARSLIAQFAVNLDEYQAGLVDKSAIEVQPGSAIHCALHRLCNEWA